MATKNIPLFGEVSSPAALDNSVVGRSTSTHITNFVATSGPHFFDDFFGDFLADPWGKETTGTPAGTVPISGKSSGILQIQGNAINELQASAITLGIYAAFDPKKVMVFESSIAAVVLPIAATSDIVIGVGDIWTADYTAMNSYAVFVMSGDGSIKCATDDGSTVIAATATGEVDAANGTFRVLRIEVGSDGIVKFFIDGTRMLASTGFTLANSNLLVTPIVAIAKSTGTDIVKVQTDYVRIWQENR